MTIVDLLRSGAVDRELAALLWLLIEGGVPVVVTGGGERGRRELVLRALLALRPSGAPRDPRIIETDGDGWPAEARALVHALQQGGTLAATAPAGSFRELLSWLTASVRLSEDAVRWLGLVVVLGQAGRVEAAHWLRPVERDGQGHLQRRPPAVLAARDPRTGELEHFAWGVVPELADRVDRSQGDFERRQADRARSLARLADEGITAGEIEARLAEHLALEPPRQPAPDRLPARPPWPPLDRPDHVH